jgi:HJR/Mrr/RecB family endonuclease
MWAFGLAVAVYVVFGALVPVALHAGRIETITLGSFGAAWSLVVILSALLAAQTANHRRLLIEWTSDLRKLDASEFEWLVGEVLRREGWAVSETGRRDGPDGGVDLCAERGGRILVVQCKRWGAAVVGVDEVRKIAGVASAPEYPKGSAALVTLSNFSEQAAVEGRRLGVDLVDGPALLRRVDRVRGSEPCPRCGTPMIVDRSSRGWWLRCPAHPRCDGKRDLASDPGAAVALLTT